MSRNPGDHKPGRWDLDKAKWCRPFPYLPARDISKPLEVRLKRANMVVRIPPLASDEIAEAMDLREASLQADDFRGMIGKIREAGFLVRPDVFRKDDGTYALNGFSFTRGKISVQASRARIRLTPNFDHPKSPRLPEDGEFLVALRDEHDAGTERLRAERARLAAALREAEDLEGSDDERAEILQNAGIRLTARREGEKRDVFVFRRAETDLAYVSVFSSEFPSIVMMIGRAERAKRRAEAAAPDNPDEPEDRVGDPDEAPSP